MDLKCLLRAGSNTLLKGRRSWGEGDDVWTDMYPLSALQNGVDMECSTEISALTSVCAMQ